MTFIYLFLTIKKFSKKYLLCLFWRFSRFGMACEREAKDFRESMDDLDSPFIELWIEGW